VVEPFLRWREMILLLELEGRIVKGHMPSSRAKEYLRPIIRRLEELPRNARMSNYSCCLDSVLRKRNSVPYFE